jgi:hypothetical protein
MLHFPLSQMLHFPSFIKRQFFLVDPFLIFCDFGYDFLFVWSMYLETVFSWQHIVLHVFFPSLKNVIYGIFFI